MGRYTDRYADGSTISARRAQKAALLAEALERLFPAGAGLEVVDFGCADGAVPVRLLASAPGGRIARITGITLLDYNDLPEKPAHAHPRFTRRVGDLQGPLDDLPLPWGACDAVLATAFFHYLAEPAVAFRHAAHLLKPGGVLLAGLPAPWVLRLRRRGVPGIIPRNRRIVTVRPLDAWGALAAACGFTERSRAAVQWLGADGTARAEAWLRARGVTWGAAHWLVVYQKR